MYRIEIWQYRSLSEVYLADDIQDILAWYKFYWYDACDNGHASFNVYKNGVELSYDELDNLGFYD